MSIASEISRLQGAKADLKTAIEGKGVTVSDATKLDGYADLVDAIQQGGGGSTLITKNISANGTYNASSDSADGYSQVNVAVPASAVDTGTKNITENGNNQDVVGYAAVNVAVPNSYSAADEGKVVSNGALVAQTSDTVTTNDTYDTTLINSLTVNVSGGGGTDYLAQRCNNTLQYYYSDEVTKLQGAVFRSCTSIVGLVLPNIAQNAYYNQFSDCTNLEFYDTGGTFDRIQNSQFSGCTKFKTLIIRNSSLVALGNVNAFSSSPFASGGTGGTLYVPNDLIASYQAASNWSTILGYATNSIKSIESTHTDPTAPIDLTLYYADGTPISS